MNFVLVNTDSKIFWKILKNLLYWIKMIMIYDFTIVTVTLTTEKVNGAYRSKISGQYSCKHSLETP